ncbi:MAG: VacJ family lipoprotein [Deltaproteobacteria bacterium]|jgi:phospholipid-binding lipoprotein MlaA|nr:VacJ family lipoprotein [Deltaproteobacteria bacterium]
MVKIKNLYRIFQAVLVLLLLHSYAWAADSPGQPADVSKNRTTAEVEAAADMEDDAWEKDDDWEDEWGEGEAIADPLEPINRIFFHFNDKLYYWVLKPVARGYSAIVPEDVQIAVRNFFDNLKSPTRAVNSLLQGEVKDSGVEVVRFVLNSTVGILGFADVAKNEMDLHSTKEDTGQTLGYYGAGGGFYINWPFLGPSNLRDSIGLVGDSYLHPFIFLDEEWEIIVGAKALEMVNHTALTMGDYELFTETALDPYEAVKDAYQQYRNGLIKE